MKFTEWLKTDEAEKVLGDSVIKTGVARGIYEAGQQSGLLSEVLNVLKEIEPQSLFNRLFILNQNGVWKIRSTNERDKTINASGSTITELQEVIDKMGGKHGRICKHDK